MLESGKTVIANTVGQKDGKETPIEIIYVTEEEGRINTGDGISRIITGDKYKYYLNKYKEKEKEEDRKKQLSSVIPPSPSGYDIPEESSFFVEDDNDVFGFDDEEEEDTGAEEHSTGVSVVKQNQLQSKKKPEKKPASEPMDEDTKKKASALPKKNVKVAFIILVIIAIIAIIVVLLPKFLGRGNTAPAGQNAPATVAVAVISSDKEKGSQIAEGELSIQTISQADYEELRDTMYVAADGTTYKGTPVSGTRINAVTGKTLIRNITAGSVLLEEDLEKSPEDASGSDNASGMQVRLVAVVSSDKMGEDMMIELGNYVFTMGELQDIMNSQGQSLLPKQEQPQEEK